MNFNHKIIWITGASSGIGKSLVIALSKQQTKLILSSRNEKELNAVKHEKQEVYIGGFKENLAVYVKRFFPKLLSKIIRKLAVT